ncbi:MAG: hypothetical protein AB1726_18460 [Planctomycetota bacterium]
MKVGKRIIGAVAAAIGVFTSIEAQVADPDARVSLRVDERQLSEIVEYLREESGVNIVVLAGGETPISIDLHDVLWSEALDLAAELAGCVVEERTAGVLVVDRPPRVSFDFDDSDLKQVIDTIAKLSGANIVIAPEVAGTLSLHLTDVPWRDALDVAVKTLGYTIVTESRGILRVVDPQTLQAQMETRSYQLRYVTPKSKIVPVIESEFLKGTFEGGTGDMTKDFPLIEALKKALSSGGELDYIASQNVLIIRDTAQVHVHIKDILDRLDVEPPQVFVDVKFVSTSNGDLFNLGVDYGTLGPQVSMSGGQIPITFPFNLGDGGFEDWFIANSKGEGPFANDAMNYGKSVIPDTIFGALSFTQVNATLRLLQRDTSTEVVQAPKIIALDGTPATIFVGETIRYAEAKSEQGQAGGLQLSVSEARNSPVEVGFQLLIEPHVIPGTNKLRMNVVPKETSLSGTGDGTVAPPGFDVFTVGASGMEGTIALPRKRSSTLVTNMLLESGQTAVIGGLTTESDIQRESRVPYLSRIPILGALFRHEERTRDKRNLLVFITPTIVRSGVDQERLLRRELDRRHGAYGDRLEEILFGEEGMAETIALSSPAPGGDAPAPEVDYRWSTFVQEGPAPAAPEGEAPVEEPAPPPAGGGTSGAAPE